MTRLETALMEFVESAGITFTCRRLGTPDGIPLVLLQHLTGHMDSWDPALAPQKQADGSLGWVLPLNPDVRCIHMGDIQEPATSSPEHSRTDESRRKRLRAASRPTDPLVQRWISAVWEQLGGANASNAKLETSFRPSPQELNKVDASGTFSTDLDRSMTSEPTRCSYRTSYVSAWGCTKFHGRAQGLHSLTLTPIKPKRLGNADGR